MTRPASPSPSPPPRRLNVRAHRVDGSGLTKLQTDLLGFARSLPEGRTATYTQAAGAVGSIRQTVRTAVRRLVELGHADAGRIGHARDDMPPRSKFDVDYDPPDEIDRELTRRRDEERAMSERRPWKRKGVAEMPARVYRVALTRGA